MRESKEYIFLKILKSTITSSQSLMLRVAVEALQISVPVVLAPRGVLALLAPHALQPVSVPLVLQEALL